MYGFADEVYIDIASGDGGPGCVSFRREKYIPKGGPDGGDGGKGGDVIFRVKSDVKTLSYFKTHRTFHAQNGSPGGGRDRFGADGEDMVIFVPPGTQIVDAETSLVLKDMVNLDSFTILKGGRGGKGNTFFKSSTNQAPRFAQEGEKGKSLRVGLFLKLIADVGLVGFPNAGKSSFINCVTNAKSQVASYPFTTLTPQAGVMNIFGKDVIIADIPGLITGASQGKGMGFKFLRHIERTEILLFLVDMSDEECIVHYDALEAELASYSESLREKQRILVGTKMDVAPAENYEKFYNKYKDRFRVLPLSVYNREYIRALAKEISVTLKGDNNELLGKEKS